MKKEGNISSTIADIEIKITITCRTFKKIYFLINFWNLHEMSINSESRFILQKVMSDVDKETVVVNIYLKLGILLQVFTIKQYY